VGGWRILRIVAAGAIVIVVALVGPSLGLFEGRLLPERVASRSVEDLGGAWGPPAVASAAATIARIHAAKGWTVVAVSLRSAAGAAAREEAERLARHALRERSMPKVPTAILLVLLGADDRRGVVAVAADRSLAYEGSTSTGARPWEPC
jgi:hypothetical protein